MNAVVNSQSDAALKSSRVTFTPRPKIRKTNHLRSDLKPHITILSVANPTAVEINNKLNKIFDNIKNYKNPTKNDLYNYIYK